MDGDGNLAALAKYEEEISKAEERHDRFVSNIEGLDIFLKYEDLKNLYDREADRWGIDTPFDQFIGENL